jgi:hypothetical protein
MRQACFYCNSHTAWERSAGLTESPDNQMRKYPTGASKPPGVIRRALPPATLFASLGSSMVLANGQRASHPSVGPTARAPFLAYAGVRLGGLA